MFFTVAANLRAILLAGFSTTNSGKNRLLDRLGELSFEIDVDFVVALGGGSVHTGQKDGNSSGAVHATRVDNTGKTRF